MKVQEGDTEGLTQLLGGRKLSLRSSHYSKSSTPYGFCDFK